MENIVVYVYIFDFFVDFVEVFLVIVLDMGEYFDEKMMEGFFVVEVYDVRFVNVVLKDGYIF